MPKEISGIEEFGINQSENMDEFTKGEFGDLEMNDTGNEYCEETGEIDNNIQRSEEIVRESNQGKNFHGNKVMRTLLIAAGLLSVRGSSVNPHRDSSKDFSNERLPISSPLFGTGSIMSKEGEEYTMLDSDKDPGLSQNWFAKQESDVVQEIKEEEKVSAEVGKQESVEFLEFDSREEFESIIPSVEDLKGFRFLKSESEGTVGSSYKDVRVVSDYINIYTFPLSNDIFPGETFSSSSVETEKFIDYLNSPKRLGEGHNLESLEGLGFGIHNTITMEGPKGEMIRLGEFGSLFGWYNKSYIILDFQDESGRYYPFTTDSFNDERKELYGKSKNTFLELSFELNKAILDEGNVENGIYTRDYGIDRSLRMDLIDKLYDIQNLRDLEEIAKEDMSMKVILGVTKAINSYPGSNIVDAEYLEGMFLYNKETYGFNPVGLDNENANPETLTKYIMNYVDEEGNSWYQDFLKYEKEIRSWYKTYFEKKGHPKGYNTYYHQESRIINDLNKLSSGVSIEGRYVQALALSDFYMNLIGVSTVKVSSANVSSVRELVLDEVLQEGSGFIHSGLMWRGYISPYFNDFADLRVGDRLIARDFGPIVESTGEPTGHMVTVFHESRDEKGEEVKWVFDIDEGGMIRLYQWNSNQGKRMYDMGFLKSMYGEYHLLRYYFNPSFFDFE